MQDPFEKFDQWFAQARACPTIAEPTAMTLATATGSGVPSARIVLLKAHGPEGFVFYSNYHSRKGQELQQNPFAALCFHWMPLERQVRVEGKVEKVSAAEADAYFASRPRARQIGAWASLQSEPLRDREMLMERVREVEAKYEGGPIPRPPHWSGWRLTPSSIEFWHQNAARLHEREIYMHTSSGWQQSWLYP